MLASRAARAQGLPVPSFSEEARRRLFGGPDAALADAAERTRNALLDEAERHLAEGHAAAALETLERAALMRHAAETELRIVRAQMALGHYRRALAFCAHAALAHRGQTAGAALYAWLLHIGGQEVVARRLLAEALQYAPGDALLFHARERLGGEWPLAGELLRQSPWHTAPLAFAAGPMDAAPDGARVIGSAVLLGDGRTALTAALSPALTTTLASEAWAGASAAARLRLWVRNGLGQSAAVVARQPLSEPALQLLTLREALPAPTWTAAPREPFAGSPGCLVEYSPDAEGRAAWPLLRQGFFAGVPGTRPHRPLGLSAPRGPRGGPVFDAAGRLVGIATVSATAGDRLVGLARLRELLDEAAVDQGDPALSGVPAPSTVSTASAVSAASRTSVATGVPAPGARAPGVGLETAHEVAYEASLFGALQVLTHAGDG